VIKIGAYEWWLIGLDVFCIVGLVWSLRYAKKVGYPTIAKDASLPATLIAVYTIVLLLYLFGVIHE
jgi:hypothetical protein